MAINNPTISQQHLKDILHYNPDTGIFTWKIKSSRNIKINSIAGCTATGAKGKSYTVIRINKKLYLAHRLVWLYMTGSFPDHSIDHADGNGLNNIFSNLSPVTHTENCHNQRIRSTNSSGILGVYWDKKLNKWRARIKIDYKNIHLGVFNTLFAAAYARHAAEIKYGFHPNHGTNRPL